MTASATNYLYLDLTNSGTLVVNTTGFPTTAACPPGDRRRGSVDASRASPTHESHFTSLAHSLMA